jgi:hypothetical protein
MRSLCAHEEARATGAQGAQLLGLREDPRALPHFFKFLCACCAARNRADSVPAARALRAIQLGAPWFAYSGNMADRPRAPGHQSGKTGSFEPPETGPPGLTKTGLKFEEKPHIAGNRADRFASRPGATVATTSTARRRPCGFPNFSVPTVSRRQAACRKQLADSNGDLGKRAALVTVAINSYQ